jgi:broad specificity phosphatase PhoE
MIRHGKPLSGWGDLQADPDPGLDAEGWEQARGAARALLALPQAERPTRVVSSPLRRCRETAQPFAEALGVEVEIDTAVSEIPTPAAIPADQRGSWLKSAFETTWDRVKGDIDYAGWARNVCAAVARHENAAIFSHFVAINAAVSVAVGDGRVRQFEPGHASITRFSVTEGVVSLIQTGASAHTQVL